MGKIIVSLLLFVLLLSSLTACKPNAPKKSDNETTSSTEQTDNLSSNDISNEKKYKPVLEFIVDGEVYKTVSTSDISEIEIPKNPEKEGFEFDGWYLDEGKWDDPFTANSLLDTPISDDMVLKVYAKFNPVTEEDSDFLFKACDGGYAVIGYTGNDPIVTIPSTYKDQPVVAIVREYGNKDGLAHNEKIQEVIIPNTVTKISSNAFENCINLTTVTIPDSVTEMVYAFAGCEKISVATLPATLLEYFPKKNLTTVVINGGTSIPAYYGGFYNCKNLTSVTIPDSITSIGVGAFSECEKLTTIRLPNSITEIPEYAFSKCKNLTTITIPDSVTSIGNGAFSYCENLNNVTIPARVTNLGEHVFFYCHSLTSLIFQVPNGWHATEGGAIDSSILSNPTSAAEYFLDAYGSTYYRK